MSNPCNPREPRWPHLISHLHHLPAIIVLLAQLAAEPLIRWCAFILGAIGLLVSLSFRLTRSRHSSYQIAPNPIRETFPK